MPAKNSDIKKIATACAVKNAFDHSGVASTKAVLGKVLSEMPDMKSDIQELMKVLNSVVPEVNSWSTEKLKTEYEKLQVVPKKIDKTPKLPPLQNAEMSKVVMRMAPYPSGPLHIGNARMVILNDEYVKRYAGKLILVYDDTIGSKEKGLIEDGYRLVKEGLEWLGVKVHKEVYKSDRMELFYDYAEKFIRNGLAYVCMCSADELRSHRENKEDCVHRSHSVDENIKLWKKMLKGEYEEGEIIVRLKSDMSHPNPAFRDRVLLRISKRNHPRVGNKYCVWPMLELSWAIDDHELGMTHILRGKDLMIEDMMEKFIWEKLGWNLPEFIHYGILQIKEAKLSKSKSREAIESGILTGWDDPRTWSLQSLRRRGITPEAVRSFIIRMGVSLADVDVPAEILYAENRKIIDSKANRYFAIFDPVKISVNTQSRDVEIPLHPDEPNRGKREMFLDSEELFVERADYERLKGKDVGLMNLFSINLGKNSKLVSDDVKMELPKIHWVSRDNVNIIVVMPDGAKVKAIAEPDITKAKVGDVVQLIRTGFCRVDSVGRDTVLYFAHK